MQVERIAGRRVTLVGVRDGQSRGRLLLLRTATAAALAFAAGVCAASAGAQPKPHVLLGAWVNPGSGWTRDGVLDVERRLGRKLAIDHHYYVWPTVSYWGSRFPSPDEYWDKRSGRLPLVSWGGTPDQFWPSLRDIASGAEDDVFRARAAAMRAYGGPILFRPMYEMNGDWFPWSGTANNSPGRTDGPALFVAAWRHMHDVFEQAGARNVLWVWSPNDRDYPGTAWNHWTNYYPGDAYVDWVGVDGYNWGGDQWVSFAYIFGGARSVYRDFVHRKPIMIAETGSVAADGTRTRPDWLRETGAAIRRRFPGIRAFVYFSSNAERDWRLTTGSSLAAFAQLAKDPYFSATCRLLACLR